MQMDVQEMHKPRERRKRIVAMPIAAIFLLIFTSIFVCAFLASSAPWQMQIESKPEVMSCEWMRQCKKSRNGTPPLLIISADGFARRYLSERLTPTTLKMGECGSRAEYLRPSYPSTTFPNHYTIATGLHPAHHGIIAHKFKTNNGTFQFDQTNGSFFGGEPIWNTAVKHGKTSNVLMWMGSYAKIDGLEASFHHDKYKRYSMLEKIEKVISWLTSDNPPDLAMVYLEQPDYDGHRHGADSFQVKEAVFTVDKMLSYALTRLNEAGVLGCINIALVSDHGMRNIDFDKVAILDDFDPALAAAKQESIVNNVQFYEDVPLTSLRGRKGEDFLIYRSIEEIPLRYHYDSEHIGLPYMFGNPGTLFFETNQTKQAWLVDKNYKATHGWDNLDEQMQTIFFAIGPSIKRNFTTPAFQNIELYNLFTDLMEIPAAANDGMPGLLDDLLANPPLRTALPQVTKPCLGTDEMPGYHLASGDPSVCSIMKGKMFVVRSQSEAIAMEFLPTTHKVSHEAMHFVRQHFRNSPLIEQAMAKIAEHKGSRIQVGRFPSPSTVLFAAGFWREGEENAMEMQCDKEENTRTEAYAIHQAAEENFNDLAFDELLFDYRVSIADIERETGLYLLPQSMNNAIRRRISLFIPNSRWK